GSRSSRSSRRGERRPPANKLHQEPDRRAPSAKAPTEKAGRCAPCEWAAYIHAQLSEKPQTAQASHRVRACGNRDAKAQVPSTWRAQSARESPFPLHLVCRLLLEKKKKHI